MNLSNVNLANVADILDGLSSLSTVLGGPQYAAVLHYASVLVKLGDQAIARRQLLLAKIQAWVKENRPPSTEELDAMKAQRQTLDDELAAIEATLKAAQP